jgi:PTS system galactitol-specific IIA component
MGVIHKELIKTGIDAKDFKEVLTEMAGLLRKYDYVKESFTDAVIEREKIYPTGLNLPIGINIAIPHTDACHVNKTAIAIGVLKNPVQFKSMATKVDDLDVSLVVMLAIKESKKQVETLKRAMEFFQEEEAIKKIINSKTTQEVYDIASNFFDAKEV